jgi:hypothetical protein
VGAIGSIAAHPFDRSLRTEAIILSRVETAV